MQNIDGFGGNEINTYYYLRMEDDSTLYLRDTFNVEKVLFDYSLLSGDSLFIDYDFYKGKIYNGWGSVYLFINEIVTESFEGISRKVWYLNNNWLIWDSWTINWVQGIGSTLQLYDFF